MEDPFSTPPRRPPLPPGGAAAASPFASPFAGAGLPSPSAAGPRRALFDRAASSPVALARAPSSALPRTPSTPASATLADRHIPSRAASLISCITQQLMRVNIRNAWVHVGRPKNCNWQGEARYCWSSISFLNVLGMLSQSSPQFLMTLARLWNWVRQE